MTDDQLAASRDRIAAQRGRLRGWRPLPLGEVAVVALEVLGHLRGREDQIGLRVVVAGRTPEAIDRHGEQAAAVLLRRRSVLGPGDPFIVQSRGPLHGGEQQGDDMLTWPWRTYTFHVPQERLPAIAGLATDDAPGDP